jgi:hypothetical protein
MSDTNTNNTAQKIKQGFLNVVAKVKSVVSNPGQAINQMDDNFVIYMTIAIVILIVFIVTIYYLYLNNLQSLEEKNMKYLYSEKSEYIIPIDSTYSNKFCDYNILTAYNACSGGNYKNDFVSLNILNSIITQGVRGFDFAIYNENGIPVVATSTNDSYYVKETYNFVKFSDVMSSLYINCFSDNAPNKTDPVILHLRIKSNDNAVYQELANLFNSYQSKGVILGSESSFDYRNQNFGQVKLSSLLGKFVIIIDGLNKSYLESENRDFYEFVNLVSNSPNMWSFRFFDILNNYEPEQLENHNRSQMTIVLPDLTNNPDNPSAALARSYGCQMVAMRFQLPDGYLLENIKYFDEARHAFVLKPAELREINLTLNIKPFQDANKKVDTETGLIKGELDIFEQNPDYSYETRTFSTKLVEIKS